MPVTVVRHGAECVLECQACRGSLRLEREGTVSRIVDRLNGFLGSHRACPAPA